MPAVDPKLLAAASVGVERDLSLMVGQELLTKYAQPPYATVFQHIVGKPAADVVLNHNPFWHTSCKHGIGCLSTASFSILPAIGTR